MTKNKSKKNPLKINPFIQTMKVVFKTLMPPITYQYGKNVHLSIQNGGTILWLVENIHPVASIIKEQYICTILAILKYI